MDGRKPLKLKALYFATVLSCLFMNVSYGKQQVYKINITRSKSDDFSFGKEIIYYKVKDGDTLYSILKKYNVPLKMIGDVAKLNNLENPSVIKVGDVIKIPLPGGTKRRKKLKGKIKISISKEAMPDFSPIIGGKGTQIYNQGIIALNSGKVDLKMTPIVKVEENQMIIDLNKILSEKQIEELLRVGYKTVRDKKELKKLVESILLSQYGSFTENGTLKLGERDKITYRYDYLISDTNTGIIKIFNLSPDTPKELKKLLEAYSMEILEPKKKAEKGKKGAVKILTGNVIDKYITVIYLLTGEKAVKTKNGFIFKKLKLFITDKENPEEITLQKMKGFKTVILNNGNGELLKKLLSKIPVAVKEVKLVIVEPPGTNGKRSKFEIKGLQIDTPTKSYFAVNGVEQIEEIPYITSRGINLIIY